MKVRMNTYKTKFFALCPVNGARIEYLLEIRSSDFIEVEAINRAVLTLHSGFHEDFADQLKAALGGAQTLVAEHHSVTIITER